MKFEELTFEDFCPIAWSGFSLISGCEQQPSFMAESMDWQEFAGMTLSAFASAFFAPPSIPWHIIIVVGGLESNLEWKIENIMVHAL